MSSLYQSLTQRSPALLIVVVFAVVWLIVAVRSWRQRSVAPLVPPSGPVAPTGPVVPPPVHPSGPVAPATPAKPVAPALPVHLSIGISSPEIPESLVNNVQTSGMAYSPSFVNEGIFLNAV